MIQQVITAGVLLVFVLWILFTIANSVQGWSKYVHNWLGSLGGAIPRYNFFAPYPSSVDYYLVYRDKLADGEVTDWRAAEKLYDRPDSFLWLWNPYYLRSKVVFDGMQALAESIELDAPEDPGVEPDSGQPGQTLKNQDNIQVSIHYLTMLEFVNSLPHAEESQLTQFAVMQGSRETDDYQPKFVSNFHDIDDV